MMPSWVDDGTTLCHHAAMDLRPYVESITRQLEVAAGAGGDEARALAERLVAPLDAAIRLALQDALAAATEEITTELAPGSVELRLRGRDPEFVVTLPTGDPSGEESPEGDESGLALPTGGAGDPTEGDEGAMSRINLRMPDRLKARIEQAAVGDGLSVNAWLVRAAAAGLEPNRYGPSSRTTCAERRSALLGLGALVRRIFDADVRYARTDRRHPGRRRG